MRIVNRFTCCEINLRITAKNSQAEIDYVEEEDGSIKSYEFKWNVNAKHKLPKDRHADNSIFHIAV